MYMDATLKSEIVQICAMVVEICLCPLIFDHRVIPCQSVSGEA